MTTWIIDGKDRASNTERSIAIEAEDETGAVTEAMLRGINVDSVRMVKVGKSTKPKVDNSGRNIVALLLFIIIAVIILMIAG